MTPDTKTLLKVKFGHKKDVLAVEGSVNEGNQLQELSGKLHHWVYMGGEQV